MHISPHGVPHQADIIARARGGSPDALGGLFAEHAEGLLRLAFRLTASTADAEDIVQDVFVGLPEALRHYEERGAFDAWLKRITLRYVFMRMRMRSAATRAHTPLDDEPHLRATTPDLEARMSIDGALAQLTSNLRAANSAAKQWSGVGGTQALFSTYHGNEYLATLRCSLSCSVARTSPYLSLPSAS